MTATLDIDTNALGQSILAEFERVKPLCQEAMAHRLATIVNHNFGYDGEDRPGEWPQLSKGYAEEYHQGVRTPTLQLGGDLQSSIDIEANQDYAMVFTNNPYAALHQFGGENEDGRTIPARPFFPIVGDTLTDYSAGECVNACRAELERSLK